MFELKFAWNATIAMLLLILFTLVSINSREYEELKQIQDDNTRRLDRFEKLIIDKALDNYVPTVTNNEAQ